MRRVESCARMFWIRSQPEASGSTMSTSTRSMGREASRDWASVGLVAGKS